jgi:hypothetical protein
MQTWAKEADADSPCDLVGVLDPSLAHGGDPRRTLDECKTKYPRIYSLLIRANADSEEIKKAAKAEFKRQRPAGSGLKGADTYPSGHATRAALQASLLTAIAPEKERELIKEAWFRGLCRLTLGVHYPTDVTAGYVFGAAIGHDMLEKGNDTFKTDLKAAQDEWLAKKH